MWLALFGLVGLWPAIAIKVATPSASLVVEPAHVPFFPHLVANMKAIIAISLAPSPRLVRS
jgi:hypothetical protein